MFNQQKLGFNQQELGTNIGVDQPWFASKGECPPLNPPPNKRAISKWTLIINQYSILWNLGVQNFEPPEMLNSWLVANWRLFEAQNRTNSVSLLASSKQTDRPPFPCHWIHSDKELWPKHEAIQSDLKHSAASLYMAVSRQGLWEKCRKLRSNAWNLQNYEDESQSSPLPKHDRKSTHHIFSSQIWSVDPKSTESYREVGESSSLSAFSIVYLRKSFASGENFTIHRGARDVARGMSQT